MSHSIFIEKFNVPTEVKDHIHKILNEQEIIILNYLADEEKEIANIASGFPSLESSLIESLYKRGYLIMELKEGKDYYKSNTFEQIFKRFINHNPKYQEFSNKEKILFQECLREMYLKRMRGSDKPVYRVIPVEKTIQDKRQLVPYYQALHYLEKTTALALIDCICRISHQRCSKPRKVCLAFGEQAKFFIDRGIGEEIDVGKGLEILNISEENGLVHSIDNREKPNFLCNCCECCCVFVQGLKNFGILTSIGKSDFIASLDIKLCNKCGLCVEKCIFNAISYEKESIQFAQHKCFGCGLCAYTCPLDAIQLKKSDLTG